MEQALHSQEELAELPADCGAVAPARTNQLRPLEEPVERIIVPAKRRIRVRDLPRQASVIRVMTARDFKAKYKQSLLGPLWLIFQPVAMLLGFVVAFRGLGHVQTSGEPYVVFTLVGLSAWSFFQAALIIGSASMLSNVPFIRFTPVPRTAFPIAALIASLPSFVVTAAAAIVSAAATGHLSPRVVLLPIALLWLLVLTAGVVALLSSLAVRFHDVISALPFLIQVSVFFVPVGYSLARLSPLVRGIVELNPLTGLMEAMRWMVLGGYAPRILPVALSLVLTGVAATVGWLVFSRFEPTMADVI